MYLAHNSQELNERSQGKISFELYMKSLKPQRTDNEVSRETSNVYSCVNSEMDKVSTNFYVRLGSGFLSILGLHKLS